YDLPPFVKFSDFNTWDEEGPPKGTLSHYPNKGDQVPMIPGAPAVPLIAAQIYNQSIMPKMILKVAQGEPMEKTLAWAENEAERLGYDSAWTGEAYGGDAVTPIAWMLARTSKIKGGTGIMQMPARTPACAAMTAMSLQALSGGRFLCGIGPSGPQVVEGWHGQPYGKPLIRTKEYVSIIRQIFARKGPLEHRGEHYQIPYTGPVASALG